MSEQETEKEPTLTIQRILVALDASTHSLAALEAAARLAGSLEAELIGLFVEDINLLRLAALPFAQELSWPSAAGRQLTEERMERDLRLRASQARRALVFAAEEAECEWSFRVVRGAVTNEVLAAALEADLLSLGRASRTLTKRVRLGSTAQAAAANAPRTVLLARQGADLEQPIVVTYDGSEVGARGLAAAVYMAQSSETNLIVFVMTDDPETAPQLAERANEWLQHRVAHAEYRYLPVENGGTLVETLQREKCGLVILSGESPLLRGDELQYLLDELDCPIMLVR